MKRCFWASFLVVIGLCSGGIGMANAAQGDRLGRARIFNINPDASSSALQLDASTENTLELDFTYFARKNIGLELILSTKKHGITSSGTPIGDVSLLPPTLTLQYHFDPEGPVFRPYAGAGINYMKYYDINLLNGAATVDSSSWGGALQLGVEIPLIFGMGVGMKF